MKWLKNWGYLFLMLLVGVLYFHYVDAWNVYVKAATPIAEWYDEQSEKYESLAKVNDWFAGVFGQDEAEMNEGVEPDGIHIAGDIGGESNNDGSHVEDEYIGEGGVSENMGETTVSGGSEESEDADSTQDNVDSDEGQDGDDINGSNGQQTDTGLVGGGTHIVIGGPENGVEVGFEDAESAEPTEPDWSSVEGGIMGKNIKWNFSKFLVDRQGNVVDRFAPTTTPEALDKEIAKYL